MILLKVFRENGRRSNAKGAAFRRVVLEDVPSAAVLRSE